MPKLAKGESAPLNVTQQAKHRIFAGLSWEPNPAESFFDRLKAKLGIHMPAHDLDLTCFVFDAAHNLVESITGDSEHGVGAGGQIYHSGDDPDGAGIDDDEQISVELKNINPGIHHMIFVATVASGQSFDRVHQPEIKLTDGYSNHNFLVESLALPEAKGQSAFIFARISRQENGWMLHNISHFIPIPGENGWAGALKTHL